jgi:hypothetical protein
VTLRNFMASEEARMDLGLVALGVVQIPLIASLIFYDPATNIMTWP